MTTRLALVCHAATEATRRAAFPSDEPVVVTPSPVAERVDVALCGPSLACRQTASAFGLTATVSPALGDCDWGRWRGLTLPSLPAAEVELWLTDPTAAPHGGESIVDLLGRVGAWLATLVDTGRVLAVTHPSVIRAALVCALRGTPGSFWRMDIAPLARAELSGRLGRWDLRSLMPEAAWAGG